LKRMDPAYGSAKTKMPSILASSNRGTGHQERAQKRIKKIINEKREGERGEWYKGSASGSGMGIEKKKLTRRRTRKYAWRIRTPENKDPDGISSENRRENWRIIGINDQAMPGTRTTPRK